MVLLVIVIMVAILHRLSYSYGLATALVNIELKIFFPCIPYCIPTPMRLAMHARPTRPSLISGLSSDPLRGYEIAGVTVLAAIDDTLVGDAVAM